MAAAEPAAGSGFFGWVKKLFGGSSPAPAPVAQPVKAAACSAAAESREARPEGRRGERGERGEPRRPRWRGVVTAARPKAAAGVAKVAKASRGPRRPSAARRRAWQPRAGSEATPEGVATARSNAHRARNAVNVASAVSAANVAKAAATAAASATARRRPASRRRPAASSIRCPPKARRAEGEREGQRRRRRGGRGGRDRDEARTDVPVNGEAPLGAEALAPEQAGLTEGVDAEREPMAVDTQPGDGVRAARGEREGGRRRGRGRNRRDGREGREGRTLRRKRPVEGCTEARTEPRAAGAPEAGEAMAMPLPQPKCTRLSRRSGPSSPCRRARGRSRPAPSPRPRPKPSQLPIDDLRALAASAGLEWVNSDAERILVVQQAMANEPKPVHVPRTPRPRVVIDDGPLVLVETRKDLSQLKLPFEQQQPARQA